MLLVPPLAVSFVIRATSSLSITYASIRKLYSQYDSNSVIIVSRLVKPVNRA